MSIRDVLNRHPWLPLALALAGVAAIGLIIWLEVKSLSPQLPGVYYSFDDGASYFSDAPDRVTPFERRGKQAVRAHVFRIGDGKPFVGYLERLTPEAGELITRVKNRRRSGSPPTPAEMATVMFGREFKKPGEGDWVPASKREQVLKITNITGPDGVPLIELE